MLYNARVDLDDALCGVQLEIPTLSSEFLKLTFTSQVIHPHFSRVIRGEGLPTARDPTVSGDLVMTFDVVFPRGPLTDAQRLMIRNANLFQK